jgi:hypothetical protein
VTKTNAWYIRRNNEVKGPFPAGQISQSLVLGRFTLQDEVSHDKETWKRIATIPELIPDVLRADPDDEEAQQRLLAARRWADERRFPHQSTDEHRKNEGYETLEYRENRDSVYSGISKRRDRAILQLMIVLLIVAGLTYIAFNFSPQTVEQEADCDAQPAAEVNWRYCRLAGKQLIRSNLQNANLNTTVLSNANLFAADLSGANASYTDFSLANLSFSNFTNASLKGANLQRADLSQANLSNADMSYADLRGAILTRVHFEKTRLDNVIWIDGRICTPGSVDICKVTGP